MTEEAWRLRIFERATGLVECEPRGGYETERAIRINGISFPIMTHLGTETSTSRVQELSRIVNSYISRLENEFQEVTEHSGAIDQVEGRREMRFAEGLSTIYQGFAVDRPLFTYVEYGQHTDRLRMSFPLSGDLEGFTRERGRPYPMVGRQLFPSQLREDARDLSDRINSTLFVSEGRPTLGVCLLRPQETLSLMQETRGLYQQALELARTYSPQRLRLTYVEE